MPTSTFPKARGRRLSLALGSVVVVALSTVATYLLWPHAADRLRAASPTGAIARAGAAHNDVAGISGFADRPAIAVLPLENLSTDPAQAFLAEGLADDLISRLSSWRTFPVIARSSSFQYRGNVDVKRVAAELGVRYVVEGSVRRAGDRIRITAQLIDAASGANVWNETYDREVGDLFALQDEISSTIAASLVGDLARAEGERAQQRGTQDLDAWSLVARGIQHALRATPADDDAARTLFEHAVARDPRFATANAWLSLSMTLMNEEYDPRRTAAAMGIARRAVELDPRDALAHMALGESFFALGELQSALDSYQRAKDLNPSLALAWREYGNAKLSLGDPAAAIAAGQQSIRIDPHGENAYLTENINAEAYWQMGRYQEGIEAARRAQTGLPGYWFPYVQLVVNAVALGRIDEARAAIANARQLEPRLSLAFIQHNDNPHVPRPAIDARRNAALRQAGLE